MQAAGDLSERVTRAAIELALAHLPAESLARLLARPASRFDRWAGAGASSSSSSADVPARLQQRYGGDVLELLNACRIDELCALLRAQATRGPRRAGSLRWALWQELCAAQELCAPPAPPLASSSPSSPLARGSGVHLIGERLVACAPPRGLAPPAAAWPRPLPPPAFPDPPDEEPECLDTLLDAADRALGVRLGRRGADGKGAWGQRAAELLGVIDRGDREPDWRGDVEIKTVAVARAASGRGAWRVVEDPAISTVGAAPLAKLQRVLWLCRADAEEGDATLVSWYLLDWDEAIAGLVERYLHVRPKGPRGSAGKGFYLHKRFFADAGLLASLNGPV